MKFIITNKLKYCTKEVLKYFNIIVIALGIIVAIILIKFKPIYKVSMLGEEIGYIEDKKALDNMVAKRFENKEKNIENIDFKVTPTFELKLANRTTDTNENQIADKIEENVVVTYKFYEIALNDISIENVDTIEEAEELITKIKSEKQEELDLTVSEKYTENIDEINTSEFEVAKLSINAKVDEHLQQEKAKKEEEERINRIPSLNGIKLAYTPVSGVISSRYGVSSRIRRSTHTGLDIAAASGTSIKVVAPGTVTCASYQGAYGNLVKVDHGNGIETWYAHTSKMYVSVGQKVEGGDIIAAVGSTGNSTGAHLHLEVRINGAHVNPQNYLYK